MYQSLSENNKKQFFTAILVVLVLLSLFLLAETLGAFKEYSYIGRGTYATNVITVTGRGEATAIPDTGSFSFSVTEIGKTVATAQESASKKINAILDAVKAMGVEDKDIKTTSYNSYPRYEYNNIVCVRAPCPSSQVLVGYEVSQTVSIKVRKTADAGAVLTKVGTLGAENISGLSFVVDDTDSVNAQARDKAIADAKLKAKALGKSLGIHLSKIVNFYESGDQTQPVYYGKTMSAEAVNMGSPTIPQIPTGENMVVSNVTITYEVD
jgi:uncharacterized protein